MRTAADLIDDVLRTLIDPNAVRWPRAEILDYANSAIEALTNSRQDLITQTVVETTVEGVEQKITQGTRFVSVVRQANGPAITQAPMEPMNRMVPDWRDSQSPTDTITHWLFNSKQGKTYYLYPAVEAGLKVYVKEVVPFPPLTDEADPLPLDDKWHTMLVDFCLHRAYAKSTDTEDMGKSGAYLAQFQQALAQASQAEMGISA